MTWVGSSCIDEALAWHNYRYERLGRNDTWEAYQTAIQDEFRNPRENEEALEDINRLRYKGDIRMYLNAFGSLNRIAGVNGPALQEKINRALPAEILDMRSCQVRGVILADHDFLDATLEAGVQVEMTKALKAAVSGTQEKKKEEGKERKGNSERSITLPTHKTEKEGRKIWGTTKEAVAGVSPSELAAHKQKDGCHRCGRENHRAVECYAKTTVAGTPLPQAPTRVAASTSGKRKRPSEDDATTAATAKIPRLEPPLARTLIEAAKASAVQQPMPWMMEEDAEDF